MGDDAHRVTFEGGPFDLRCWGPGTTGNGCTREVISQVGLCASCQAEILRRGEERRARRSSEPDQGRIVETDVTVSRAGGVVTRLSLWGVHPVVRHDGSTRSPGSGP